ncbi:NAD(P)/FAD-dependent oxidoreductase [Deminuibacter soli]|uniref:FAD-binding oxidoreductase n=1 Tax=Deminuibacter soli TaxID=2291815 RepID=A0A3E1NDC0_9BACT|nr:FAD-dependent oxidoreductase [Deminuibacter soli]RFM25979.1 FAD-binding oxidoreductase [Deminuibacter soli]
MQVQYIIVGQGICGTFLSWQLMQAGQSICVIDTAQPFSSTKVASGVINPVTGRQIVTTWLAEELLPFCMNSYTAIGETIGADVIQNCPVMAFPPSQQMQEAYAKKMQLPGSYIQPVAETIQQQYDPLFYFRHGVVAINPSLLIQLHPLLKGWRSVLSGKGVLRETAFDAGRLALHEGSVAYDDIHAEKIIFCDGLNTFGNPWWGKLPFVANKGQALIIDVPGLPQSNIYKFGPTTLVPWYDGLWWAGSSYENDFEDALPTDAFKKAATAALQTVIRQPFTVVDHLASIRPACIERRPFVGFHPQYPQIGILNGMGTKGCSLAPYFAAQLTGYLVNNTPIMPEAAVQRFARSLARG